MLILAIVAIGAVGYNEYHGQEMYKKQYKHGWSNLLAWSGAGELFLSSIFSYVVICLISDNSVGGVMHIHGTIMHGYEMDMKWTFSTTCHNY